MLIRSLRSQHTQLLELARKVVEPRSSHPKERCGRGVRDALDKLASVLVAHLDLEDRELYPPLLLTPDADVSQTARRFCDEVGGLSAAFRAFDAAWRDPARIQAHWDEFGREWTGIKDALNERIMAEENLLYMLGERALKPAG